MAKNFRELGLNGIGVADVMTEAGNGFGGYKHFESCEDLVIEALAESFKELDALEQRSTTLIAYLLEMMADQHLYAPFVGCAITLFAGDAGLLSTAIGTPYTQKVKHSIGYFVAISVAI